MTVWFISFERNIYNEVHVYLVWFSGCSTMTESKGNANGFSDANDWDKPCKFPFKYDGEEHISCIPNERKDDDGNVIDSWKYWCATEVDADRQMLKSGVCKDSCSGGKKIE